MNTTAHLHTETSPEPATIATVTMRAGDPRMGGDREGVAGVVIEPGQDLCVIAGGERVVGEVGLPHLVGLSAWKRTYDDRGRFVGAGVTRPWRRSVRSMVARDTRSR
jgi:hypothetical protein